MAQTILNKFDKITIKIFFVITIFQIRMGYRVCAVPSCKIFSSQTLDVSTLTTVTVTTSTALGFPSRGYSTAPGFSSFTAPSTDSSTALGSFSTPSTVHCTSPDFCSKAPGEALCLCSTVYRSSRFLPSYIFLLKSITTASYSLTLCLPIFR